jgi:hypothetical protein
MTAAKRFLFVNTVGAGFVGVAVLLLWWSGVRGPLGIAIPLALALPAIQVLDDRLAGRPPAPWRAVAMGMTAGVVGWLLLTALDR